MTTKASTNKLGVMFSSGKDDWQTPRDLFTKYDQEFAFTVDGAASETNTMLRRYWDDSLETSWEGERVWLNPPYSQAAQFVEKAAAERHHALTVLLIPSRTDTAYWHNYIWDEDVADWYPGVEGRFLRGRLKFTSPLGQIRDSIRTRKDKSGRSVYANTAPFPSVVVIFGEA